MKSRNKDGGVMDKDEIVNSFSGELRRGTVVLCVLANLGEPTYGYGLIEKLSKTGISVEANTLYPLLRRLEGQGLLQSEWNTDGAKPRKYYCLTDFGKEVLSELIGHWSVTVRNMNKILEGLE
jgi:DNA-binding PadR family transcriptional regulator